MPTWHSLFDYDQYGRPSYRRPDTSSLLADLISADISAAGQSVVPAPEPIAPELPPVEPPAAAMPEAGPSRADQAARFAQDVAYGRSDWERAGQALAGEGRFEEASGLRRTGAVLGGVGLGTLALASWIPGFNVFKPAQAARAARAFGTGAAEGARAGTGIVRGGWDAASDLEQARRAARRPPEVPDIQVTERAAPAPEDPSLPGLRRFFKNDVPTPLDPVDAEVFSRLGSDQVLDSISDTLRAPLFARGPSDAPAHWGFEAYRAVPETPDQVLRFFDSLGISSRIGRGSALNPLEPIVRRHSDDFIHFAPDAQDVADFVRRGAQEAAESPEWAAQYFGRSTTFSQQGWADDTLQSALFQRGRAYQNAHNAKVFDRMMSEIEDAYPAIASMTERYPNFSPRVFSELESFVSAFNAADVRPVMTIWEPGLMGALKDGALLNQFLTNSSSGYLGAGSRISSELAVNGISPGVGPLGRPIYGYLVAANPQAIENASPVVRNVVNEFRSLDLTAPYMYGDIELVFKPSVKNATTFTVDDSLAVSRIAAPISRPLTEADAALAAGSSFNRISPGVSNSEGISYFETQMIRPLLTDIERIVIHSRDPSDVAALQGRISQGFRSAIGEVPDITAIGVSGFRPFSW
jgi:hypothetical protein